MAIFTSQIKNSLSIIGWHRSVNDDFDCPEFQ
jgi:hypothetical protein